MFAIERFDCTLYIVTVFKMFFWVIHEAGQFVYECIDTCVYLVFSLVYAANG